MLSSFAAALSLLWKLFGLWFPLTSLLFWRRPRPFPRRDPKTRFAVILPARNEERVIGALIRSLRAGDYPAELYDIYAVPNNCTDRTEQAARAAGAEILHPAGPVRCKGDVLHQAMNRLLPMAYDAYLVLDADNVVTQDYLSRLNDAFCAGARAVKSAIRVKNPEASWVSACYALYYGLSDCIYNRSRAVLGLSAKLVGTGFALSRELLQEMGGWNTVTIAEDAELAAQLAARGERLWWVPEAVTRDEAPVDFRTSLTQRRRWCSGIMSTAELRMGELVRSRGGILAFDMGMFLSMPFWQALSPVPMLLLLAGAGETWLSGLALSAAAGLLGTLLLGGVVALLLGERGLWK